MRLGGKELWDRYAWMAVLPPNRPDEEVLESLRRVSMQLANRSAACVLGSTPEFRYELGRLFESVDVLDISAQFKSQVDWMAEPRGRERFVEGDWVDTLPQMKARYDLVVAHFIHGNVPWSARPALYRAIGESLRPAGRFFDVIFQPTRPLISADQVLSKYGHAPWNMRTLNDLNSELFFLGEYIGELGYVQPRAAMDWIASVGAKHPLVSRVLALAHGATEWITPIDGVWHYSPDRDPFGLGYIEALEIASTARPKTQSVFRHATEIVVSRQRPHG